MASKELRLLVEGDVITTIWQLSSYSGEDDFEMWDASGHYAYSDPVTFDCADGEIFTTVYKDEEK